MAALGMVSVARGPIRLTGRIDALNVALMELDGTGSPRQDGRVSQDVPQVLKSMDFEFKRMDFVLKTMNFVFKMMTPERPRAGLADEGSAVAAGDAVYFDTGRR